MKIEIPVRAKSVKLVKMTAWGVDMPDIHGDTHPWKVTVSIPGGKAQADTVIIVRFQEAYDAQVFVGLNGFRCPCRVETVSTA